MKTCCLLVGRLMMFYGCRSEHADHFFSAEWNPLVKRRELILFTAFSRDQVVCVGGD